MKRLILLALLCSACVVAPVLPQAVPSTTIPVPTAIPSPTLPAVEPPARYNFLLLGGDYTAHRAGTNYGDKTDVILLVSILMEEPTKITVVQFPRNLYVPVEAMDDQWLFHVYSREGFVGLHYYFQQVFDVDLHGIFYVNMDGFVSLVDGLGGLWLNGVMDGEQTLAYLRDNKNNWGCPEYDCANRQFVVLRALAEKIKTKFHEDPLTTARFLWDVYGGLFETDLSDFEQIHWLVELGWRIATSEYEVEFLKLTESGAVVYGDVPLEVRGWIAKEEGSLTSWFKQVLSVK